MDVTQPRVLVLGAGGIIGEAWMVGLLAGLNEASGFDARQCDHFVGTSAGSIVAAALAAGVDPRTRLERIPEQSPEPRAAQADPGLLGGALRTGVAAFAPLAGLALRSTALGGALVRRTALGRVPEGRESLAGLERAIAGMRVDWDGRLHVVAVEVESGRRVVFGTSEERSLPVATAVRASCAIPGVFQPVRAGGRTYVDGGAWSLTNLDVAPVSRATRVLCLNPTGSLGAAVSLRGAVGSLSRSVAGVEALALQGRGAKVTTIAPDADSAAAMGTNFMDPRRRARTQDAGWRQGLLAAAELAAAA
jgi:NTE family protein